MVRLLLRLLALCGVLLFAYAATPAQAGDFWSCNDTSYWCTRDAIYAQFKLIARLEADPDVMGRVSAAELDAAFDPASHLRAVDRIFARVFGAAD